MTLVDWLSLGVVLISLLLSAFFSASETAMTASSRARLSRLQKQGQPKAGLVRRLLDARERLIGAMLVGNNIANIGASTLTTGLLLAWFGGPAEFRAPDALGRADGAIVAVRTSDRSVSLPSSAVGAWTRGPATHDDVVDVVDLERGSWQRGPAVAAAGTLVRQDLAGDPGSAS